MSDVKRWEPENTIVGYNMRPDPEGSFVLHEHYAKLEAEAQALREEVAAAHGRADTLEHRMMGMMTRHFAEAWRKRDTTKELDGYLSAGIAELERDRDAALEEVATLRARVVVDEHAEFERLFSIYKMKRHHHGVGGYTDFMTHCVFEAFQAGVRINGKAVSEGLLRSAVESILRLAEKSEPVLSLKGMRETGNVDVKLADELSTLLHP
ncbi:hypothetical protein [Pseudomonas multiresinivorans]|uniref:hypothetical protein n=1 Tax=Pseudomonas multiresinivorans TaxID=95301 RepID=UPI0019805665|nr:hypothetical protein [Pseudomonas multiresinivorans]